MKTKIKIKNERDFWKLILSLKDERGIINVDEVIKKSGLRLKRAVDYLNYFNAKGYLWYYDEHHSRVEHL